MTPTRARIILGFVLLLTIAAAQTRAAVEVPEYPASAVIDLATDEGAQMVRGEWRYHDVDLIEVDFREPGADRKPSGGPNRTLDYAPRAGARDFDDTAWRVLAPDALDQRVGTGRICFGWYRIRITVPERIGGFDPTGAAGVLSIVVDDYAEIWVDGELPRSLGQSGGTVVAGFNAPNRLVIGEHLTPGQQIQIAVFAMNGPLSDAPANYLWVRSATLEFFANPRAIPPRDVSVTVERFEPGLDAIVPAGAKAEKIAEGFLFGEGPVWVPDGYLLFSDPNANRIYRWHPQEGLSVFRDHSGYSGPDVASYRQPGSNGLTLDGQGRLTLCEHGNRRVSRLEPDGRLTVIADRHRGLRLNSPNDLVYGSDGTLYFSDPPFGLPGFHNDPTRELPSSAVFAWRDGDLRVVSDTLRGPNGVALSPDERVLYVANWDESAKVVMAYDVHAGGTLSEGRVFFDMKQAPEQEALDGLKVDRRGNLYVSGPGGVWILSPQGGHLGTLRLPELPANFAWGDADGRTLYMTARAGLYRMRLGIEGVRPMPSRFSYPTASSR